MGDRLLADPPNLRVTEIKQREIPVMANETDTQGRSLPWTDAEIEILTRMAHEKVHKKTLIELIPNRTWAASKRKLVHIRHAMGIQFYSKERKRGPRKNLKDRVPMLKPDDPGLSDMDAIAWRENFTKVSANLLAALKACAR